MPPDNPSPLLGHSEHRRKGAIMDGMTVDDFIRDVKTDPYMAMVQHMYADAWAMGYEAARQDAEQALSVPVDELRAESYSALRNRAMREMFDKQQKAEAEMVVALAALGRDNPGLLGRFGS